jgi:hypothetical protein
MKTLLQKLLLGKNNKLSVLLILALVFSVGLACKIGSIGEDEKKPTVDKKADEKTSSDNSNKKSADDVDKKSADENSESSVEKANASKGEVPSDKEMQDISQQIIKDFNRSIQDEDFTDFRAKTAKLFQKQYDEAKMKDGFQGFIDKKRQFGEVFDSITDDTMTAAFDEGPSIEKEGGYKILKVKGSYSTFPKTKFEYEFMPEGKDWKLLRIVIKVGIE